MGPKPVSFPEEDRAILNKVNSLLSQLHVDRQVGSVEEIGAGVFVTLFEGLCGEQLTGIVRSADTREDEVHNCQVVIDSLAGDVLHTSLTHIAGADIIDGSREAISNLLEIFSGLLEYMLNKIDSDISTDNDEDDQNLTTDDPDRITRDEIDDILDMELRRERLMHEAVAVKNGGPTVAWEEEPSPNKKHAEQRKTQDVQKQGKPQEMQKSTKPQEPQKSGKPQGIEKPQTKTDEGETTADLIKESEEIERRLAETRQIIRDNEALERRLAETRARATQASMGPTETDSPLVEPRETLEPRSGGDSTLDRQRETRADIIRRLENDPRYKYMLPPTQSQTQAADEQTDETFRTLQSMVEETAAMARAAVKCNPQEARSLLQSMETNKRLPERSRRERQYEGSRSRTAKRASPSARHASPKSAERLSDNELTPSKAKRKVSFLMERSLTDTSTDLSRSSPTRRSYHESSSENTSYQDRLRKQYEGIVTLYSALFPLGKVRGYRDPLFIIVSTWQGTRVS
ncbi:hypothetical protein DPMN_017350 [Dreissena polymorpha]|uniref:DUF5745 domain-containing protein n=1 Tax=Dreissena polymorpha TaxID=45954 RepID=A0A9D4S6A9_DREPO|nr:hypothetical protein DPMN_017350 [Dreissena polymorpha]